MRKAIAIGVAVALTSGVIGTVALYRVRERAAGSEREHAEYFCPMHPQIVREKPGECPVCGMKLERREKGSAPASAGSTSGPRRILYYRHPMNPAVHSDRPAKDEMGMDYVPVYPDEAAPGSEPAVRGRAAVTLTPERVQLLGIRSEPVTSGDGGGALRTVGRVAVDERRRMVVHARYEGYVERLFADFTGRPVVKGQPLLAIHSPEVLAAQEEHLVARRAQERLGDSSVPGVANSGPELLEASRQRLLYFGMSADEIAALEQNGRTRPVMLRSPVSGVVMEKAAFEGMKVSPADRLYAIVDLARVWVLAEVQEKDLAAVRLGGAARVALPYRPGREWRGQVSFVSPSVKPDTRTAEVRIETENAGGDLKPEMFADVLLETSTSALAVPESAVVFTGERTLVFLDRGQGRFEPREVTVGGRVPGGYEVLGGLAAGDRVAVSANFLLDSESSLRAAISSATPK